MFLSTGITNGSIFSVALAPDGKILIGGSFRYVHGQPRSGVARLLADGSLDASFNPGVGVTGTVYTVSVLTNGAVFIGGDFLSVNGLPRARLALLSSSGTVDPVFGAAGGADNTIYASVIAPDQRIFVGGDFTSIAGQTRRGVAKLNIGGLDTLRFTRIAVTGGAAVPRLTSEPGRAYVLEGSDTLGVWFPVSTNLASGVSLDFSDPGALTRTNRYYRARRFGP